LEDLFNKVFFQYLYFDDPAQKKYFKQWLIKLAEKNKELEFYGAKTISEIV